MPAPLIGFMPRRTKANSRTKQETSITVGVHIPTLEYIEYLDRRVIEEYRSRSEYLFLLLREDKRRNEEQSLSVS
jgi:hypothetical protein